MPKSRSQSSDRRSINGLPDSIAPDQIGIKVLNLIPDSIVLIDNHYKIQYINHSHFQNKPIAEGVIGDSIDAILPSPHQKKYQNAFANALNNLQENHFEQVDTDGTCWLVRVIPVAHHTPSIVSILILSMNITQRKKKEAAVEENHQAVTQRLKKLEAIGALSGGITHEFNNLLWIIEGNLDLIRNQEEVSPQSIQHYLDQIETACLRAKDFTQQLIAFSRQTEKKLEPLKLSILLQEFIKLMRSSTPSTIEIKSHLSASQDVICADLAQIQLLLMTLFTNTACSLQSNGGLIEISLINIDIDLVEAKQYQCQPGPYIAVSLMGSGKGLKLKNFADDSLLNDIVRQHGGIIKNTDPKKNHVGIHIFIPCGADPLHAFQKIKAPEVPKGTEKILFIDDEPGIVDAARRMLRRLGYQVEGMVNGNEALKIFRAKPNYFDLIITDMTMPNLTGIDILKAIRSIRSGIPIILCTGYSDLLSPENASKCGFDAYLLKPVHKYDLAHAIRLTLDENKQKSGDLC